MAYDNDLTEDQHHSIMQHLTKQVGTHLDEKYADANWFIETNYMSKREKGCKILYGIQGCQSHYTAAKGVWIDSSDNIVFWENQIIHKRVRWIHRIKYKLLGYRLVQ